MGIKQLNLQQNIPDFELSEKYSGDVWDVTSWDYYKNAVRQEKTAWNMRSSVTNKKLDFTQCENAIIREELKYCFYRLIEINAVCLTTFAEKYDHLKHIINYLNSADYTSCLLYTSPSPRD